VDTAAFLRRIGLPGHDGPCVESLFRLHAAYTESVPYESIQFQLDRDTPLDPVRSAERIIAEEAGGYCFQVNGALSVLLTALGYQVTLHRGGAHLTNGPAQIDAGHLVLTVAGLPDDPDTVWLVDAGLGDGLHVPLPLRVGSYRQAPYTFGLRPSEVTADGWWLDHDERGSIHGMDFDNTPAKMAAFAGQHAYLSVAPDSPFVRVSSAFRRTPTSQHVLRSLTLSTLHPDTTDVTVIDDQADWYAALQDVFGLPMPHLSVTDRDDLWRRVVSQHEAFLAANG